MHRNKYQHKDYRIFFLLNIQYFAHFYKQIINGAPNCLKPNGFLAFELGINQAQLVKNMLEKDFKNIEIIKDLAGIERVILAQLK